MSKKRYIILLRGGRFIGGSVIDENAEEYIVKLFPKGPSYPPSNERVRKDSPEFVRIVTSPK